MYRLIQVVIEDTTQSQSMYEYDTETELMADFHAKYGSQVTKPYYKAMLLVALDGSLKTIDKCYYVGTTTDETGETTEIASLNPRLVEVKTTTEEVGNLSSYDTEELVIGNFHSKLGSAMKNENVKLEVLKGIDGKGNEIIYESWIREAEITE